MTMAWSGHSTHASEVELFESLHGSVHLLPTININALLSLFHLHFHFAFNVHVVEVAHFDHAIVYAH